MSGTPAIARGSTYALNYVWDPNTQTWVAEVQPGGGGGGGGAVTVADGADVTQGSTADAAVTGDTPGTVSAKLRGLDKIFTSVWDSFGHFLNVNVANVDVTLSSGQAKAQIVDGFGGTPNVDSANPGASEPGLVVRNIPSGIQPVSNTSLDGTLLATLDTDIKQISTDVKSNIVLAAGSHVIGHVVVDSGSVTTPAVTNDNTFAKETGGHLATIDTSTAPLGVAGAGGYVRQDSTATIAKESGGNLALIKADVDNIPAKGAALTAASMPVTIASDQVVPISLTTLPLPTGAALEAGGNLDRLLAEKILGNKLIALALMSQMNPAGFIPCEIPSFLLG